jgi:hypothetical protein
MGAHTCTISTGGPTVQSKMSSERSAQKIGSGCDVLNSIEAAPHRQSSTGSKGLIVGNEGNVAKQVTFKTTMQIFPTLHLKDCTDAELNASWYSRSEYDTMRSKMNVILLKLNQLEQNVHPIFSNHTDTKHPALRGLESLTRSGAIAKRLRRNEAIRAVLTEQCRQYKENGEIRDSQQLADVYSEYTQISNRLARGLGIADEQETIHC